jgi:hypothetical protein
MSIGEKPRNFAEICRVAAIAPGAILITPWRIEANQDGVDKDLDQCGCAFCPDDPGKARPASS